MTTTTRTRSPARPWWADETPIALRDVPAAMQPRADGRRVSAAAPYRWCVAGVWGVKLRRFRLTPSTWATTREELERWRAALTLVSGGDV